MKNKRTLPLTLIAALQVYPPAFLTLHYFVVHLQKLWGLKLQLPGLYESHKRSALHLRMTGEDERSESGAMQWAMLSDYFRRVAILFNMLTFFRTEISWQIHSRHIE